MFTACTYQGNMFKKRHFLNISPRMAQNDTPNTSATAQTAKAIKLLLPLFIFYIDTLKTVGVLGVLGVPLFLNGFLFLFVGVPLGVSGIIAGINRRFWAFSAFSAGKASKPPAAYFYSNILLLAFNANNLSFKATGSNLSRRQGCLTFGVPLPVHFIFSRSNFGLAKKASCKVNRGGSMRIGCLPYMR